MRQRLLQGPLAAGPCTGARADHRGGGGRGASRGRDTDARAAGPAPRGPRLHQSRLTFADTWVNFCRQPASRPRAATRGMEGGATDYAGMEKAVRLARFRPLPARTSLVRAGPGEREKPRTSSAQNQIAEIRPAAPRSPRARVTRHTAGGPGGRGGRGRRPAAPGECGLAVIRGRRGPGRRRSAPGAEPGGRWAGKKRPARGRGGGLGARGRRRPGRARGPEAAAGGRQDAGVLGP